MTFDRYSVCEQVLRMPSFDENLDAAAESGATGMGLRYPVVVERGAAVVRAAYDERGLAVTSLEGALGSVSRGTPASTDDVQRAVDACAALGAPGILVTTGPLEGVDLAAADARGRAWFEAMAPVAADAGVRLMLEPVHPLLRWASYVHTLRHAVEITGGLPGTGVVLDVGHLWWDRDLADDVARLAEHITTVQIDDVDGTGLAEYRYVRTQLGAGVLPLTEMVRTIERAGYSGWYENESAARLPRDERAAYVRGGGEWLTAALART